MFLFPKIYLVCDTAVFVRPFHKGLHPSRKVFFFPFRFGGIVTVFVRHTNSLVPFARNSFLQQSCSLTALLPLARQLCAIESYGLGQKRGTVFI